MSEGQPWTARAECLGRSDDEAFGPEKAQRVFVRLCRRCSVRAECFVDVMRFEAGLPVGRRHGARGGYLASERVRLARGHGRRCADCPEVIVPRVPAQVRCEPCGARHKALDEIARRGRLAAARGAA